MKKNVLCISVSVCFLFLFFTFSSQAQIRSHVKKSVVRGNPEFSGTLVLPAAMQKMSSRLSPELKKLYENSTPGLKRVESTGKSSLVNDALSNYIQIRGDKVVVDITVKDDLPSARAQLQKMGLQITGIYGRVISGLVPISALPQLESATSVQFARPAYKPIHHTKITDGASWNPPGTKIVPVISQGDTAQRSYIARAKYHVNGNGVKVGILSDSYNNLGTAQIGVLHGELPGPGNPFNFRKPVQVIQDLDSGGTDEGRAMAEIVHDVAPGSEIAFNTADLGQASFAQGIVNLANAGCGVIGDDVSYFAEPFFQDGIIAQAVDQVKKAGVAYFSAAGNEGVESYESVYRPTTVEPVGPGNGTAHNFSAPGATPRYFQPIYIPPGGSIIASFQWDESSFTASGVGCQSDFDIYLSDINGNIVAAGASDNIASGDPIEVFGYFNNTTNYTFFLTIVKFAGPDVNRLKYVMYNDAEFYLTNPPIPGILSSTLFGHAKADGAIAVGAAWYQQTPAYGVDTPIVEFYSSEGGVANYFDIQGNRIAPLIRNKPEIVAPDGVFTSFFNPFGEPVAAGSHPTFFGTSAATPHAAGVAALMIEAEKLGTLTPAQIKGVMESHTVDMDDPNTDGFDVGFDFATGYGLVKADGDVGEVKFPNSFVKNLDLKAVCSDNPSAVRNWEVYNPNPFDMDVSWFVAGTSQHGTLTAPPGISTFSTTPVYFHNSCLASVAVLDWEDNFGFTRFDLAFGTQAQCGKDQVSDANSDKLLSGQGSVFSSGKPDVAEVYPNPSSSTFRLYLSLSGEQNVDLQLLSADGRQLQARRVSQSNGVIDIDASGYRPGVYLLRIMQGGGVKTIKLIKQ